MTIDEFIKKWGIDNESAWLESLRIDVSKLPAEMGKAMIEAKAELLLLDLEAPASDSAATAMPNASIDEPLSRILEQLDAQLEEQQRRAKSLLTVGPSSEKPIVVVLTGAGFSNGFGLPTTAALKEISLQRCDDPAPDVEPGVPDWDAYPLSEFRRECSRIPDIEYLLTLWAAYLDQMRQTGSVGDPLDRDYDAFLENLCCHLYQKGKAAPVVHDERFTETTEWLRRAVISYDVRFITFNYDLLLELLCENAEQRYGYLAEGAGAIPIRKLHGSLNWRRFLAESLPNCSQREVLIKNGDKTIYSLRDLGNFGRFGCDSPPVIVPPSASKQYDLLLWQTWRLACDDIARAQTVLIIGYSFPPLDVFATVQLSKSLRAKPKGTVRYVSPSETDCARALKMLGEACDDPIRDYWRVEHLRAAVARAEL